MHPRFLTSTFVVYFLSGLTAARTHAPPDHLFGQEAFKSDLEGHNSSDDRISISTRAHWMRVANSANDAISPCPFAPFGTAIVNHSDVSTSASHPGQLICTGVNHNGQTGNPTLHGEMSAFANCSSILTDPNGLYRLSSTEALEAWKSFSLYTTAEPCPMCASAVVWAGVKEVVFGVGIEGLIRLGWKQIEIGSAEVLERGWRLGRETRVFGGVLEEELEGKFGWQFGGGKCTGGCKRVKGTCKPEGV